MSDSPLIPPRVRRALNLPSSRERLARALDDEVGFHIEMRVTDLVAQGMSEADARAEAARRFGDPQDLRDYCQSIEVPTIRRMRVREWLESCGQDVRFAARQFRRSPGFVAITAVTLGLGIGTSTAIFSVINGVILRPLPYPSSGRIMQLFEVTAKGYQVPFADPNIDDLRRQNRSFAAVAHFGGGASATIVLNGEPMRARLGVVSQQYFHVLRVTPVLGRTFSSDEAQHNGAPAAVLSYEFWQTTFGGRRDALGSVFTLQGHPVHVVGVMPPVVRLPVPADLWIPAELEQPHVSRSSHNFAVIARLRDGVTLDQSRADVSAILRRIAAEHKGDADAVDGAVIPLQEQLVGRTREPLMLLLGASLVLFLIACANVVNLLVARMAARQGEVAVRVALGAARYRIVQQSLAESCLLAFAGAALGLALAWAGVRLLLALNPTTLPRLNEIRVDWQALGFVVLLSLGAAVVLGLLAAWRAVGGNLREALSQTQRVQSGAGSSVRRALVVLQMGMTVVLMVSAGLLARSFVQVMRVDPGFRIDRTLVMDVTLPAEDSVAALRRAARLEEMIGRLRAVPGVARVGTVDAIPLGPQSGDGTFLVMTRHNEMVDWKAFSQMANDPVRAGHAEYRVASDGYFQALDIPLVRGRLFNASDAAGAQPVAVISATLAKDKWPGEDPIGKIIQFGNMDGDLRTFTIVGIVGDVHDRGLTAPPQPMFYGLMRQRPQSGWRFNFAMVVDGDPAAVTASARRIVRELAPDVAPRFNTMEALLAQNLSARRFTLVLIGVFAAAALLLAVLGVYSVISYLVTQRRREMSIRVALGARGQDIVRLVLGQGVMLSLAGIVAGGAASVLVARLLSGLLFGIGPMDPPAFGGVAVVIAAAAALASWVPARRASGVDAMDVLRGG
jgi:putative ABC transport system permease protein